MKLKANLHFHSAEDPVDIVPYSLYEGIDQAAELGFDVLASTCHTQNICTNDHISYAAEKGILLVPGIEANIYEEGTDRKNHVVILNCDDSANSLRTFEDLRRYRQDHPEIFVIAPHPYFYGTFSLADRLEKYINLFDAVEHSWFFTRFFNRNIRAALTATLRKKPLIATSDTHFLDFMGTNYCTIETKEKTIPALFEAIQDFKYENVSTPRSLFDIFGIFAAHEVLHHLRRVKRSLLREKGDEHFVATPQLEPVYVRAEE